MESHAVKTDLAKKDPPPGLHVILGDSAGGTFSQAFDAGDRLFVDPDVLSCGPTRPYADLETWNAMRLGYWNSLLDDGEVAYDGRPRVLANLPQLHTAERINLWFATSLSEQLSVAFTLEVLEKSGVESGRVYLLRFEHLRDQPRAIVRGMGELNPGQMADYPEPAMLTQEVREDYCAAWAAMTSEDPHGFERFASARPNADAWLTRAMQLMLRRFPDRQTGLVHWDRVLLSYATDEPRKCARIIGEAIANDWDDGDFVGDSWMFARLLAMADEHLPQPLLRLDRRGKTMREIDATITPFGRDVLEGRVSNYPTNPIEDWAAGTRLSTRAGALWFNDGGRLVKG